MEESHSKVEVSISPGKILYRLQELRKMQLAQQERLLQQQGTGVVEDVEDLQFILNQFSSDSTTYNTFHQLLFEETSRPASSLSNDMSLETSDNTTNQSKSFSRGIQKDYLIEGVSPLNLSKESEPYLTPIITNARSEQIVIKTLNSNGNDRNQKNNPVSKKHILLDDMPILSPKKDFETLILEKMKSDNQAEPKKLETSKTVLKKPFLRRGEGLARFGMKKNDVVLKPNRVLPWKKKHNRRNKIECNEQSVKKISSRMSYEEAQETLPAHRNGISTQQNIIITNPISPKGKKRLPPVSIISPPTPTNKRSPQSNMHSNLIHTKISSGSNNLPKTWATVLTQEQETFLRQLKQTAYYRTFDSPAKSVASDTSTIADSFFYQVTAEKELAEQNLFELLERKVSNASFCSNSSFFGKFINSNNYSGNSTPLVTQNFIASNPQVLNLHPMPLPEMNFLHDPSMETNDERIVYDKTCYSQSERPHHGGCESEDDTSSSSSCSTCKNVNIIDEPQAVEKDVDNLKTQYHNQSSDTIKPADNSVKCNNKNKNKSNLECQHNDSQILQINKEMAEMNAKLVATSEMLKERLQELEGEIEVFRNENAELARIREEIDLEKQKFFEEKATFEQKFNEEKILSEYYIAEEKEKLAKQKNIYEKYVRDLKGKLNKKEREEVIQLKREIEELKDQIRTKDAKSTTCIARLRNQVKSLEKENTHLKDDCEKLRKENRKIQLTNTTTRRLSNIKYLAELNKKLGNCEIMDNPVPVSEKKHTRLSTGTICKNGKTKPSDKSNLRARTRSVPNLTVTSSYAKYFSQRDIHTDRIAMQDESDSADEEYIETYRRSDEVYSPELELWRDNPEKRGLGDCIPSYRSSDKLSEGESSNRGKTANSRLSNDSVHNDLEQVYSDTFPCNQRSDKCDPLTPRTYSIGSGRSSKSNNDLDSSDPRISENNLSSVTKTSINPQEISRKDGSKELRFPNGNVKLLSSDGKYTRFVYYNGDVKETFFDQGSIKYFFAETKTYHTTYKDGLEVLEFPDGQIEKRYKDGAIEIHLPNGSIRYSDPKDKGVKEEWRFPDGTVVCVNNNDEQTIRFPNGQVEIHTKEHKRRQFPDGTVKTVYADGTSETRFASGRIRVKDKHGNVIMDNGH